MTDSTKRQLFTTKSILAQLTDSHEPELGAFTSPLKKKDSEKLTIQQGSPQEDDTDPPRQTTGTTTVIRQGNSSLSDAKDALTLKKNYSVPLRNVISRSRLAHDRVEDLNTLLKDIKLMLRENPLLSRALVFDFKSKEVDLTDEPFMMTKDAAVLLANKLQDQVQQEYPDGNAALDATSPLFASQLLATILLMSCDSDVKEHVIRHTNSETYHGFDTNGVFVFTCIREYLFPNTAKFHQAINLRLSKFDTFTGTYKQLLDETNLLRSLHKDSEQQVAEGFVRLMAHHPSETVRASFIPMNAKAVTGAALDKLANIVDMAAKFLEDPEYGDVVVTDTGTTNTPPSPTPAPAEEGQEQRLLTLISSLQDVVHHITPILTGNPIAAAGTYYGNGDGGTTGNPNVAFQPGTSSTNQGGGNGNPNGKRGKRGSRHKQWEEPPWLRSKPTNLLEVRPFWESSGKQKDFQWCKHCVIWTTNIHNHGDGKCTDRKAKKQNKSANFRANKKRRTGQYNGNGTANGSTSSTQSSSVSFQTLQTNLAHLEAALSAFKGGN